MAILKTDEMQEHVPDVESTVEACEKLGVTFGCYTGVCGSCEIEVVEGMKNLSGLTREEIEKNLKNNRRLACRCRIKKDSVKIRILWAL